MFEFAVQPDSDVRVRVEDARGQVVVVAATSSYQKEGIKGLRVDCDLASTDDIWAIQAIQASDAMGGDPIPYEEYRSERLR
ncbi:MAG: hypothetical protein ABI054_06505, partial [Planctomycetota bacterium]